MKKSHISSEQKAIMDAYGGLTAQYKQQCWSVSINQWCPKAHLVCGAKVFLGDTEVLVRLARFGLADSLCAQVVRSAGDAPQVHPRRRACAFL